MTAVLPAAASGSMYARVGVESLVGDQHISLHGGQQAVSPDQVVCLAAGQEEADRVTQRVDQDVDFLPIVKRKSTRGGHPAWRGRF